MKEKVIHFYKILPDNTAKITDKREIWGHSIITLTQNNQDLEVQPPIPFVYTCLI